MVPDQSTVILAYRSLYRYGLQAVQYSKPSRYTLRDTLSNAFRTDPPSNFNAKKIGNTILFLQNAAKVKGLEHRILKSLLFVRWWEKANMITHPQSVLASVWGCISFA